MIWNWIKGILGIKDDRKFFESIRLSLFGGSLTQEQVDGLTLILKHVTTLPIEHQAYILATAFHETGKRMQPIREAFGQTDQESVVRLENAYRRGRLNVSNPYWRRNAEGNSYFGRGYVQLTWEENYQEAGEKLGYDLVNKPELALKPEIAVQILVRGMTEGWFSRYSLSDFDGKMPDGSYDFLDARKIVNGVDRQRDIANYAYRFMYALKARG